jgi:hypothetical protein
MTKARRPAETAGEVSGNGARFAFDYKGADTAIAINRLLKDGAQVAFDGASHVAVTGVSRSKIEQVARTSAARARRRTKDGRRTERQRSPDANEAFHAPRVAMYQPWTGGNMDEGWTRWVLEQYEFNLTSIHNADIRAGKLRQKFDTIIIADQNPRDIIDGFDAPQIRPSTAAGSARPGSTT